MRMTERKLQVSEQDTTTRRWLQDINTCYFDGQQS